MKVREGFVSNSSSTAFLIRTHRIVSAVEHWVQTNEVFKKIVNKVWEGCCDMCAEEVSEVVCPVCEHLLISKYDFQLDNGDTLTGHKTCDCGAELEIDEDNITMVGQWYYSNNKVVLPIESPYRSRKYFDVIEETDMPFPYRV